MIDRLGKPVDRAEWGMSPQTVNAYYNPRQNEIVFPAAILRPPFFNPDADDAVNYIRWHRCRNWPWIDMALMTPVVNLMATVTCAIGGRPKTKLISKTH